MKTLIQQIIRTTRIGLLASVLALMLIPIMGYAQNSNSSSPDVPAPPPSQTIPAPPSAVVPSPPAANVAGLPGAPTPPANPGGVETPVWEANAAAYFPTYFPALANYGYATSTLLESVANYLSLDTTNLQSIANYLYINIPYFQSMTNYLYMLTTYGKFFYDQAVADITGPGPYGEPLTLTVNAANLSALGAVDTAAQAATSKMVTNALTMTGTNANIAMSTAVAIPGTDISGKTTTDNSVFNFDTLFGPVAYTDAQSKNAQNTLLFLTASSKPLVIPTLSADPTIQAGQLAQGPVQSFFISLRNYITSMSTGMSNLNYLIAERTVQPGLGTQAGYTTLPTPDNLASATIIPDASPLQIQQFMVQRRINNPTWYTQMNQADNTELTRESLFVLAEISAQLYQLHLDSERIMATMAVTQIGTGQIAKNFLNSQSQQIQTALTVTH